MGVHSQWRPLMSRPLTVTRFFRELTTRYLRHCLEFIQGEKLSAASRHHMDYQLHNLSGRRTALKISSFAPRSHLALTYQTPMLYDWLH